jgi:hypothetical protein
MGVGKGSTSKRHAGTPAAANRLRLVLDQAWRDGYNGHAV